jgi:GH25 family lysozyme M1 (1,4-beta-N-acetylmuramidase)
VSPRSTIWQYFIGDKEGIAGRVDRNTFVDDLDDLRDWASTVRFGS